jgi:hypothetical protein
MCSKQLARRKSAFKSLPREEAGNAAKAGAAGELMMSTCIKCGAVVGFLKASYIDIRGPDQSWAGVSCVCPKCDTVLSVLFDPIALKDDVVQEVITNLQRRPDDGS